MITATQTEWKKPKLEEQLNAEGWTLLTNVVKFGFESRDLQIENAKRGYGAGNVRVRRAYDAHGKPLPDHTAIYVRTSVLEARRTV